MQGTSATGSVNRTLHMIRAGDELMLSITKDGVVFKRDAAIVVSMSDLLSRLKQLPENTFPHS
jgi:hypothetical protein